MESGSWFPGELHPEWAQKYELPLARPVVFELELDVVKAASVPVSPGSQSFRRSFAIWWWTKASRADAAGWSEGHRPRIVQDIQLFDVYAGKGIQENKKVLLSV